MREESDPILFAGCDNANWRLRSRLTYGRRGSPVIQQTFLLIPAGEGTYDQSSKFLRWRCQPSFDFRNLKVLNLICYEKRYLLRGLTPSGGQVLCPLLRGMKIVTRWGWSPEWYAFMRMVKAKKKAGYALKKVVIDRWDGTPEKATSTW